MNKDQKFEKFIREMRSIKMTSNEKDHMRSFLESHIAQNSHTKSPYSKLFTISRQVLASSFILILGLGIASKPASSSSLPGEVLYPVKIIHEEIVAATKNDGTKKAQFEIERTEKRIQEATSLIKQQKLGKKEEHQIAESIKAQTEKVKEEIRKIEISSPEQALVLNTELKTTIEVNTKALKKSSTRRKKASRKDTPKKEVEIEPELAEENLDIPLVEDEPEIEIDSKKTEGVSTETNEKVQDEDQESENNTSAEAEVTTEENPSQDLESEVAETEATKAEEGLDKVDEKLEAIESTETTSVAETIKEEESEVLFEEDFLISTLNKEIIDIEADIKEETEVKDDPTELEEDIQVEEKEETEEKAAAEPKEESETETKDNVTAEPENPVDEETSEELNENTVEPLVAEETEEEVPEQLDENVLEPLDVEATKEEVSKKKEEEASKELVSEEPETELIQTDEQEGEEDLATENQESSTEIAEDQSIVDTKIVQAKIIEPAINSLEKIVHLKEEIEKLNNTKLETSNLTLSERINEHLDKAEHDQAVLLLQQELEKIQTTMKTNEIFQDLGIAIN